MRWASAGLMVLLAWAAGPGQETTGGWVKYSSADAKVAILFPGEPKVTATKGGKVAVFEPKNGKRVYVLRFDPFPAKVDPADAAVVGRAFDGAKAELTKTGVTIRTEKPSKLNDKYPVLELDTSSKAVAENKIRFIVTERWLIQVHAGGAKGAPATEDARLFLNSLLLKE